jgi:hypothetical protein
MRAAGFDVFVTADRNLGYQQNIATAGAAVLVLHARSNRIADLRPFAPALLTAIAEAPVGTVTHIGV